MCGALVNAADKPLCERPVDDLIPAAGFPQRVG
jgi:hypothetical protein